MHARPVIRDVVLATQQREEIVRGEHGVAPGLDQPFLAERLHIGICTREHAEVPEGLADLPDGVAEALGLAILARGVVVVAAIGLLHDPRLRQERP